MKNPAFNFFRYYFPKKIWQQIFLVLIFLVLIPMLILGSLLINTSQNTIKETVLSDYKEIVQRAAAEVQERIQAAQISLSVTASLVGTLGSSLWRQETAIVELSLKNSNFQRVSFVNPDGQELVTSALGTPLVNHAGEMVFQKALKNNESYISDVRISENYVPTILLAEPVEMLGEVRGVLLAELSVRDIWETIDSIRVGKTGRTYLIDEKGRIIAHPDKKVVLENAGGLVPEISQLYLTGKANSFENERIDGKKQLVAFAPVEKLNWMLIIRQDSEEALSFSKTMQMQSWILILLSILAAVFISLFLARYMSRPLNKIVDATNLMARGDYRNTFRIKRRDEVGRLMFSFNRIKVKLLKAKQMEKTAVIGEAATAIAHELKNSLVLVDTFINLLPERHRDRKFIKEFSDTIPKELESWKSMLRGMMEFSKQKDFPKTSMNVNTVVQDVVALVHLRAKQKNIQLFVREQHNIPNVLGNTEKIKQVVLNIISNSIDATPLGGAIIVETNWLAAETKGEAEHIEIKITNTGKIISQGELNKIFNPFFTTKSQGMGLGLAISYDIIKQHNGRIDVQSNKVQGTYFSVKLPVLRKEKVEKG